MGYTDEEIARLTSYRLGLIPPEDEAEKIFGGWCCCGKHDHDMVKVATASELELELAGKKHRWKEFNKLAAEFFSAVTSLTTRYEKDWLKLWGLPELNEVRRSIEGGEVETGRPFVFSADKWTGMRRIFREWQEDIIGKVSGKAKKSLPMMMPVSMTAPVRVRYLTKQEEEEDEYLEQDISDSSEPEQGLSLYQFYMLSMFAIGLKRTLQEILDIVDPHSPNYNRVAASQVLPNINNEYLTALVGNGLERVKNKFDNDKLAIIRKALVEMANTGRSCLSVARYLHKEIGEGRLWEWNRFIRSEMTLAYNAAYNAQADRAGINFDQWSAAPTACDICKAFDSQVWRRGEGPEPVLDTHPHCLCTRVPFYSWEGNVNPAWGRDSPYDVPYPSNPQEREEQLRFWLSGGI